MSEGGNIFAESLLILNRAALLARDKYLDYEHSIVNMHISYTLLHMSMSGEALRVMKLNIENILSNGGLYDKGKALFLFAQCAIAAASTKEDKLREVKRVHEQLDLAIKYFTKLECWQKVKSVYVYLAKLYNQLGMNEERNHNAYKFRLIAEEHTNSSNDNVNLFY
jgi:anaphase-promoting complex subunit 5